VGAALWFHISKLLDELKQNWDSNYMILDNLVEFKDRVAIIGQTNSHFQKPYLSTKDET